MWPGAVPSLLCVAPLRLPSLIPHSHSFLLGWARPSPQGALGNVVPPGPGEGRWVATGSVLVTFPELRPPQRCPGK